jgi:hypothetical protein
MRSATISNLSAPAALIVLAMLLMPASALAFGGIGVGVGVGIGHGGGGVGVGVGHGDGGVAVGQGGFGFSGGPGDGGGPGIGTGQGSGGLGHGEGSGGAEGPGGGGFSATIGGSGDGSGGGGHGDGGHGGDAAGGDGGVVIGGPIGGGSGSTGEDGGAEGSHGSGGITTGDTTIGTDGSSSATGDSSATPGGSSATSIGSAGDGSGSSGTGAGPYNAQAQTNSQARRSYEQRRAAFLAQRALVEMGMGLRRPDRGMEGAMQYARTHPNWSLSNILSHAHASASARDPHFDRTFSTVFGTLPLLPKMRTGLTVARTEKPAPRVFDPPVAVQSFAAITLPPRKLHRKADQGKLIVGQAAANRNQQSDPAAAQPIVAVGQSAPPLVVADRDPQPVEYPVRSTTRPILKTSVVGQAIPDAPSLHLPQAWSIVGQVSHETNSPLPKRGPILLIVFLSALSAYMFVRWTSVKCSRCGKFLDPGIVRCRRCGARLGSIRA